MIPPSTIARMASLGLTAEQAEAVAVMLSEVESATEQRAQEAIDARRKADRDRQARHRDHVKSRDITGQNVSERDTETAKESLPHTPSKKTTSSLRSDVSLREREAFCDEVWQRIPKRRGDAPKPFRKALMRALARGANPALISAGLARYVESERGGDPQYRKGAAVWVNAQGWEADYSQPAARAGPRSQDSLGGFHAVHQEILDGKSPDYNPFSAPVRAPVAGVRDQAGFAGREAGTDTGRGLLDLRPAGAEPG